MNDKLLVYSNRVKIIKALAHPVRLFIVYKLKERTHCVCELTAMIGFDISTVSKHLSVLKKAGLVDVQRSGTTINYSLKCPCILDFMSCVEGVAAGEAFCTPGSVLSVRKK